MRDDYEFIYWRPCDVPDIQLHPDISEAKTSDDEAMIFMMMTEISNPIPQPGAVDTYDPLDHMVLTADGSIEITLKRGDSSILITPEHDPYEVQRAIIDSGASISHFQPTSLV